MRLTIHNLTEEDFGTYRCLAKNSQGESDGIIKFYGESDEKKWLLMTLFKALSHRFANAVIVALELNNTFAEALGEKAHFTAFTQTIRLID